MKVLEANTPVGVVGAGTMGAGIAQVAATAGHPVRVYDTSSQALQQGRARLEHFLRRRVEKGKLEPDQARSILERIYWSGERAALSGSGLVIEAIVEDLDAKKEVFRQLEETVAEDCLLATNTSSLSITSIAAACRNPGRVLGTHFFNPAPLMRLGEIIPGFRTEPDTLVQAGRLIREWGKTTVVARDTPGFIVNRVARPFYGEAIKMLEEGVADASTIDWAMRERGGFRMGPFELMDLIGNDVNFEVTETLFRAFFGDPRYRPSFTQKRMVEAGLLGRKSGRGFYNYGTGDARPQPRRETGLGEEILLRILVMLMNEAAEAVFLRVASVQDVDQAMKKGVNYPKGPLEWADEMGLDQVWQRLHDLQEEFGDDRYRPSPLIRRMARRHQRFHDLSQPLSEG
ncbi:MAG: 3-hydroxyacyl-CoA dehydrogenase NAD-binding domain-containing protein [Acidobacteriota bacterium]